MLIRKTSSLLRTPAFRSFIPIIISLIVLWILRDQLAAIDLIALSQTLALFEARLWITALALSALSFYAIAQYDRIAAHLMRLPISRNQALMSGWRATALSQVLGYGLITGALVRWWSLGANTASSLWNTSRMTVVVAACFFSGWGVVTSAAILVAHPAGLPGFTKQLAWLVIGIAMTGIVLSLSGRTQLQRFLPSLTVSAPVIFYTLLDTVAAASIIYIFLPDGYVGFFTFFTAYLIALAVGMTSGLPGGLGAFELSLIALLGLNEPEPLLSAILAYRLAYFAVPALSAAASLIAQNQKLPSRLGHRRHGILPDWLRTYAPPEAQLLAQDQLQLHSSEDLGGGCLKYSARHCDLVLGDPFGETQDAVIIVAQTLSENALRPLCLYKCSSIMSDWAKSQGWLSLPISSEACVTPREFNLEGSAKRQLRRKLSQAQKAGVTVAPFFGFPDALAEIDLDWQMRNGGAKRFSIGFFDQQLLSNERIWVAYQGEVAVAFITVMTGAQKWTLDLIRTRDECPDGVIHALVVAAIDDARKEAIPTLSLASVPFRVTGPQGRLIELCRAFLFRHAKGVQGLYQFKKCFDPYWRSEHLVANGVWAGILGTLDLVRLINSQGTDANTTHNHYGFYEFASNHPLCYALKRMTRKGPQQ